MPRTGFRPTASRFMREGAERFSQQWGTNPVGLGWTFRELFDLIEPICRSH
jgi:hypothetical protein